MQKAGRNKNELLALTGIRGIAAVGVLLAHINADLQNWIDLPKILYAQAYVDLFFILSGFVISYVYMEKSTWSKDFFKKFYIARFARIYPLYIFASIVVVLLLYFTDSISAFRIPSMSKKDLIKEIFLLNSMPNLYVHKLLVYTSWSVSIEWWLYLLLFPVLIALKSYRKILSSPVIITIITIAVVFYIENLTAGEKFTRGWPAWIRGVSEFSIGWLIHYHYQTNSSLAKFCRKYVNQLGILWLALILLVPFYTKDQPWIVITIAPYLLLGLCYTSKTSNLLSTKAAVFLGDISYSVYLLHPIILMILKDFMLGQRMPAGVVGAIFTFIGMATTFLVSMLTYKLIEKPFRAEIQQRLTKLFNNSDSTKRAKASISITK